MEICAVLALHMLRFIRIQQAPRAEQKKLS